MKKMVLHFPALEIRSVTFMVLHLASPAFLSRPELCAIFDEPCRAHYP